MDYIQSNGNKTDAINTAYINMGADEKSEIESIARNTVKRISARNFGTKAAIEFLGALGMLLVEKWKP